MKKTKIHIGTSGWSYAHWKDNFYPKKLPTKQWLKYYGEHFSTVEVNSSFYHMPLESTIQNWSEQVPKDFLFSLKASRYLTHLKRLQDCKENVEFFLNRVIGLKKKLGPILFQLPPSFKADRIRLLEFITYLTKKHRYVFEFRHPSWFTDDIYDILSSKKIALCITDLNGTLSPEVITTDFTYIRLHGPKKAYQGTYGPRKLKEWHDKIEGWSKKHQVFCYFDNDEKGYAIQDADSLKKKFTLS